MVEFNFAAPVPLSTVHDLSQFDCGKSPLNEFLQRHAFNNERGGASRTFVATTAGDRVVGYYSLAAAAIAYDLASARLKQGQPRHPIPAILMARFAVDLSAQGRGLGRHLFRDALLRSLNITNELGARAFVVDAKDELAAHFYMGFGMMSEPHDPFRLFLLFKDIRRILQS